MQIKRLEKALSILFIFLGQSVFAVSGSGPLFNVIADGGALAKVVSATICLNAAAPLSCQNVTLDTTTVKITATVPNHLYSAGIKINTPGYTVANPGNDCKPLKNGYCVFTMSNTLSASISITTGVTMPPILFVASSLAQGNFNANGGADKFCAASANQNALFNPVNYSYKALIVTRTRYPCNYLNGAPGCGSVYSSDWPLSQNTTYYYPDGVTVFNTTNNNGVFDGSNPTLHFQDGSLVDSQHFLWVGIQSVLANNQSPPNDIAGWAYSDLNPGSDPTNDGVYYSQWSPRNCNDWTDNTSPGIYLAAVGLAGQPAGLSYISGAMPEAETWGNYYIWQNNTPSSTYFLNVWSVSYLSDCPSQGYVICVAATQ